jgi:hypothetical protein
MGDARDLGARVRARPADAGAQGEDAALRARDARQAALEAQDVAAQGVLATLDARGAALGPAASGAILAALALGAGCAAAG